MIGDDVDEDDVAGSGDGGGDRKLGLPARVVDVLRQMRPYADRLTWTVSEDASAVSLALVWDLRLTTAAASSWRRRRWLRPAERPPQEEQHLPAADVGLLQRLKRRLDRRPGHVTGNAASEEESCSAAAAAPVRGRGLLRRCVTSLTAIRLWKARQSQSSPSLSSSERLDATTTAAKQRQQQRLRQQTVGNDDLLCRSRFTTGVQQVSRRTFLIRE